MYPYSLSEVYVQKFVLPSRRRRKSEEGEVRLGHVVYQTCVSWVVLVGSPYNQ